EVPSNVALEPGLRFAVDNGRLRRPRGGGDDLDVRPASKLLGGDRGPLHPLGRRSRRCGLRGTRPRGTGRRRARLLRTRFLGALLRAGLLLRTRLLRARLLRSLPLHSLRHLPDLDAVAEDGDAGGFFGPAEALGAAVGPGTFEDDVAGLGGRLAGAALDLDTGLAQIGDSAGARPVRLDVRDAAACEVGDDEGGVLASFTEDRDRVTALGADEGIEIGGGVALGEGGFGHAQGGGAHDDPMCNPFAAELEVLGDEVEREGAEEGEPKEDREGVARADVELGPHRDAEVGGGHEEEEPANDDGAAIGGPELAGAAEGQADGSEAAEGGDEGAERHLDRDDDGEVAGPSGAADLAHEPAVVA